jgi:hypothetical protein
MSADGGDAPTQLDCPWCAEPISSRALVCRQCRRDVALPMPILLAQRTQAREVEALRREVLDLRAELAMLGTAPAARTGPGTAPPTAANSVAGRIAALALGPAAALAALVGAHWVLILRYDAAPVALRTACILLSLGAALATPGLSRVGTRALLGLGALLGLAAVLGMSWNVARADGTAVLPATARDLFEMLEFAASIGFSFVAGGLLAGIVQRARHRSLRLAALQGVRGRIGARDIKAIGEGAESLKKVVEMGAPVAALCGALAAGFRILIGGS